MGQSSSRYKPPPSTRRLPRRKRDVPYVKAIANDLDWKRHLQSRNRTELKATIADKKLHHNHKLPVAISENVYISNASGASNIGKLKMLGITHVLNVGGQMSAWLQPQQYKRAGIKYKLIPAEDEPTYPILARHLDESRAFLKSAREEETTKGGGGKCLVHSLSGCNRAAVIVAADYMLQERKNVLETVLHCRMCRGNDFLRTNAGFQSELVALARKEKLLGPAPGKPKCIVQKSLS